MKQLLNISGDNLLHAVDDGGRTALHLAAHDNQKLISDFLISRGSNPEVPDVRSHKSSHYTFNVKNGQDDLKAESTP